MSKFILNETESIVAIENRLTPNLSEILSEPFLRYTNKLKRYHTFFSRIVTKR